MKLASVLIGGKPTYGAIVGDGFIDLTQQFLGRATGVAGVLATGLFGDRPEAGVVDLLHRDADDPERRHQPGLEEPQQSRQQAQG